MQLRKRTLCMATISLCMGFSTHAQGDMVGLTVYFQDDANILLKKLSQHNPCIIYAFRSRFSSLKVYNLRL